MSLRGSFRRSPTSIITAVTHRQVIHCVALISDILKMLLISSVCVSRIVPKRHQRKALIHIYWPRSLRKFMQKMSWIKEI